MAISKVVYGTTVLVDLTNDTVTSDKLLSGFTAHDKSGSVVTGTYIAFSPKLIVTAPIGSDVTCEKDGVVITATEISGTWTFDIPSYGDWIITSVLGSNTATTTVNISASTATLNYVNSVFSNNDWSAIASSCKSGSVPSTWAVGDSKSMTIDGVDYQIDIIGKNHDSYSDGGGVAPLTFQMHTSFNTKYVMNSSSRDGNSWGGCLMRTATLSSILNSMPIEVQNAIREVNKFTSEGANSSTISTTADKLFLLSEVEVLGTTTYSFSGEGSQYSYYSAGNSAIKTVNDSNYAWWLRSPRMNYDYQFCRINSSGSASSNNCTSEYGLSCAFCF